ncbi:glycosyltransferase [uncultured Cyclobacterium sp.]|uniref:glycosyltransferase n=1 Tax=uncultured Cyclobacterium sp. TaxID=453820 RepID=UPI0030EE2A11|tara:strand:- start:119435 stop:120763 length:1329 start_codon:yes stop_codon:yes gene_type:complete
MGLPKVLIFGQPFNQNTGGGITLSNLFRGWDKNKIAVVGTGHMLRNLNTDICDSYYQLGINENKWIFPFNKFQRKFSSGIIDIDKENLETNNSKHTPNIYQKPNLRQSIVDLLFYPLLKYFGIFHKLSSINISDEFSLWLKEFNPDILYIQVQARDEILFTKELHTYLKIPLIIHIMDDWPSFISSTGLFKKYWHNKIDDELKLLFNRADVLMGISDEMAKEYKMRYDKNFITFHNPINIEFWKQHQRSNYEINESCEILYAGRMGVGIESSLELIAEAVTKVNIELGINMRFVLQTQEKLNWFDKYMCVEHRSFVQYNDLPRKFSEADFLVLPYDFMSNSIRYIKYSMPTKVSEYMISGTPIIVLAPEETAMVKYAQEFNWAKVFTKNDVALLSDGIINLVENKKERERIAQNAINVAEKNHDSNIVTKQFKQLICSLIKF